MGYMKRENAKRDALALPSPGVPGEGELRPRPQCTNHESRIMLQLVLAVILSATAGRAFGAEAATVKGLFDGSDGAPWPKQWIVPESGQSFTIEGGRGRVGFRPEGGGTTVASLDPQIEGTSGYTLNSVQQVCVMSPVASAGMMAGLAARQHDTAPSTYYCAVLDVGSGHTMNVHRRVRGRDEILASLGTGPKWESGKDYQLKLSVEQVEAGSTRLRAKMWPGDQEEPAGWQLQTIDKHPALQQVIGRVGIVAATSVSAARRWYFSDYEATAAFVEQSALQSPTPRVVRLPASGGRCIAMSDAQGIAVVGESGDEGRLSVFRLDESGDVIGAPTSVALPRPAELGNHSSGPLSAAFHPTLLLLYVWQDFSWPSKGAGSPAPAMEKFDHLIIYRVGDGQVTEVGRYGRGKGYAFGEAEGAIAVDAVNRRLYLPNLRSPADRAAIGYLFLDEDGLPVAADKPVLAEVADPARDRKGGMVATGWGYVPGSAQAAIFGSVNGPMTWDQHAARAQFEWLPLPDAPDVCLISGHPSLPLAFVAGIDSRMLYRVQHAHGYLTMLPDSMVVSGASFQSAPVVMAGRNQLAIGDVSRVCIVSLDGEGCFTPTFTMLPAGGRAVRALAYSEKFDRLYVPVERVEGK